MPAAQLKGRGSGGRELDHGLAHESRPSRYAGLGADRERPPHGRCAELWGQRRRQLAGSRSRIAVEQALSAATLKAARKGIDYAPRTDERTLAHEFRPAQ